MMACDSVTAVDLASLASPTELYLGQLEPDLPQYEACGVIRWSYPEWLESTTHFLRHSQLALRGFDGNPIFDVTGKPLGAFHWATSLYEE